MDLMRSFTNFTNSLDGEEGQFSSLQGDKLCSYPHLTTYLIHFTTSTHLCEHKNTTNSEESKLSREAIILSHASFHLYLIDFILEFDSCIVWAIISAVVPDMHICESLKGYGPNYGRQCVCRRRCNWKISRVRNEMCRPNWQVSVVCSCALSKQCRQDITNIANTNTTEILMIIYFSSQQFTPQMQRHE